MAPKRRSPSAKAPSRPARGAAPTPPDTLERTFEGRARLDALLTLAGSVADAQDVAEAFQLAQKDGVPAQTVLEALFDDEPRFPSPAEARALYSNLFGLWELMASGAAVDLSKPAPRVKAKRPPPPPPPGPYGAEGPDTAWVEQAWRYLEGARPSELNRLKDAFENKQDALLLWLDDSGLSDVSFGLSQLLFFELFAMLELGSARGVGAVSRDALEPGATKQRAEVPPALAAYAEEALFEAEQDEQAPLSAPEAKLLRQLVEAGLAALWSAQAR